MTVAVRRTRFDLLVRAALVMGVAELGFATIIPLLPLYLKDQLGASTVLVGYVVSAFALTETVFKSVWGWVGDRVGRKPLIVGGLLLASLAPTLMATIRDPDLFVPLRLVDGLGSAALFPAMAALISDLTDPDRRAAGMGTLNLFFFGGLAFGPALGTFIAGFTGSYRAGFYAASGLLVLAALFAMAAVPEPREHHLAGPDHVGYHASPAGAHVADLVQSMHYSPQLLVMLMIAFVQLFGVGLLAPILVIYAKHQVGLSEHLIGVLFLTIAIAVALSFVPAGHLADRVGKKRVVLVGMVLASLGMWAIPAGETLLGGRLWVLALAAATLGVSYALTSPAWLALVSELAPPGRAGAALGAAETAQGFGLFLGPLFGGHLYDAVSPVAPFVGSALVLTVGAIIAIATLRR